MMIPVDCCSGIRPVKQIRFLPGPGNRKHNKRRCPIHKKSTGNKYSGFLLPFSCGATCRGQLWLWYSMQLYSTGNGIAKFTRS
jgi:hypothetical protein